MKPRLLPIIITLYLMATSGCSQELGAESFQTGEVTGTIHVGPKPLAGGFIEFHPYLGTVGTLRVARIGPDGTFKVDRVPAGQVILQFEDLPGGSVETLVGKIPTRYFKMDKLRLIRAIKADESNPLDIDLGEEAIRYFAQQSP
jgi:hypothetical protein